MPQVVWGWPALLLGLASIIFGPPAVSAPPAPADRNFSAWDANRDGVLTRDEVPPGPRRLFDRIDSNGDGRVTLEEHRAGGRRSPPSRKDKPGQRQRTPSTGLIHHTIRQAWAQEPQGVERLYTISLPDKTAHRWPIVILLHGNGGEGARMIGNWPSLLPGWLVVAPQGYERSWNISTERSKAPDVAFIKEVLADVSRRYPQADGSRVSLQIPANWDPKTPKRSTVEFEGIRKEILIQLFPEVCPEGMKPSLWVERIENPIDEWPRNIRIVD